MDAPRSHHLRRSSTARFCLGEEAGPSQAARFYPFPASLIAFNAEAASFKFGVSPIFATRSAERWAPMDWRYVGG
jgi:hypothetical protein